MKNYCILWYKPMFPIQYLIMLKQQLHIEPDNRFLFSVFNKICHPVPLQLTSEAARRSIYCSYNTGERTELTFCVGTINGLRACLLRFIYVATVKQLALVLKFDIINIWRLLDSSKIYFCFVDQISWENCVPHFFYINLRQIIAATLDALK